jgi:N-acetylmuramoyl-L-alanine amidase
MARGFAVVTTRESDMTVNADRRAEIANHANAQACLSLHASESGSGVHLFVSSLAPVEEARFQPWKTAQAAWVQRSLLLAGAMNSALGHAGMAVTLGRTALPAVESMACPAVAVEVAPERASKAQGDAQGADGWDDPSIQAHVAEALAAALVEWRQEAMGARQP